MYCKSPYVLAALHPIVAKHPHPLGSRLAAFTVAPCSKSFLAFAAQSTLRRSAPTVKAFL